MGPGEENLNCNSVKCIKNLKAIPGYDNSTFRIYVQRSSSQCYLREKNLETM